MGRKQGTPEHPPISRLLGSRQSLRAFRSPCDLLEPSAKQRALTAAKTFAMETNACPTCEKLDCFNHCYQCGSYIEIDFSHYNLDGDPIYSTDCKCPKTEVPLDMLNPSYSSPKVHFNSIEIALRKVEKK